VLIEQEFEEVEIGKLKAHPRNPRTGDTGAIKESIEANGFYGAVIAQRSTGFILAGNHRWKAAKEAGASVIPVAWVDVEEEHANRIMLADNRTNDMASYDENALASLLTELNESCGLEGTGYKPTDLDLMLPKEEQTEKPEVEFSKVIGECNHYVVLVFENDIDWLQAQSVISPDTVKAKNAAGKEWSRGVGRVMDGPAVIDRIRNRGLL
jgi:hypothetical protein|tara:strand:- start:777 stop:1406 length:630 start_codon:yes stop_codon:yes gene_type:complete